MTKDHVDPNMPDLQLKDLARWTHMWAAAAVLVLAQIEQTWDTEDPVGSVGKRNVLALVLLDAVRNTYRGAQAALGQGNPDVLHFEQSTPRMKELRDRFEHFDEYLQGIGRMQRQRRGRPALNLGGLPGLEITASQGGGRDGHSIDVKVVELTGDTHYTLMTRSTVEGACKLARTTLNHAGLLDARHLAKCSACADAAGP